MKKLRRLVLLLIAFALAWGGRPLHSQTMTVSTSSSLRFNMRQGTLSPAGILQINISCVPGAHACPTRATVYADFPQFCGLSPASGEASGVPASIVEARVNGGETVPFNSAVPPANNGCGATIANNVVLRPAGATSISVPIYVNLRDATVPIQPGVIFQATLRITVETF
ncbi:MAG: hypothetical protein FWD64_05410 [Acidobacteriaceae bacterium]|nr:hypothetical protein [Acidobacteriaceae bacterium]